VQDNVSLWPGLLFGFVFMAIWLPISFHHSMNFTPKGVVKRLRKENGSMTLRVPWLGGSWNPAKAARVQNELVGPGRAIYHLTAENEVEVDYWPRWGKPQHFKGPVPAYVDQMPSRHLPRLGRRVLLAYCLFLLVGALIGAFVAHGSASSVASGAAFGFFAAMIVASLLSTLFTGIMSFRHHSTAASLPTVEAQDAALDSDDLWKRVDQNKRIAQRYLDEHGR
jgi:hypothetical protein